LQVHVQVQVQVGGCGLGRQQGFGQQHGGGQSELPRLLSVFKPQQMPFPKPPMMQLMPLQMSFKPLSQQGLQQGLQRQGVQQQILQQQSIRNPPSY